MTEVKEQLPAGLYNSFVSVIVAFFIIILIRLAFSDLIAKANRWLLAQRSARSDVKLAADWIARFTKISDLAWDIEATTDYTPEQKTLYQAQRDWLITHRARLLRLWYTFEQNRDSLASERDYQNENAYKEVFLDNYRDPFSCFYSPLTLPILKSGIEHDYRLRGGVKFALAILSDRGTEFLAWMKSR